MIPLMIYVKGTFSYIVISADFFKFDIFYSISSSTLDLEKFQYDFVSLSNCYKNSLKAFTTGSLITLRLLVHFDRSEIFLSF